MRLCGITPYHIEQNWTSTTKHEMAEHIQLPKLSLAISAGCSDLSEHTPCFLVCTAWRASVAERRRETNNSSKSSCSTETIQEQSIAFSSGGIIYFYAELCIAVIHSVVCCTETIKRNVYVTETLLFIYLIY